MGAKVTNQKPLIADRNIVCYKTFIFDDKYQTYLSPNHREFDWGPLNKLPQSFFPKGPVQFQKKGYNLYVEGGTIHAYGERSHNNFKCIIPKGTEYWVDVYGTEYCAREIRIIRKLEDIPNGPVEKGLKMKWHNLIDSIKYGLPVVH